MFPRHNTALWGKVPFVVEKADKQDVFGLLRFFLSSVPSHLKMAPPTASIVVKIDNATVNSSSLVQFNGPNWDSGQ